jgi:hypothetical protein
MEKHMNNVPGKGWCGLLAMLMVEQKSRRPVDLDTQMGKEQMIKFIKDTGLGRGDMWIKELVNNYTKNNGYIEGDKWVEEDEMVGYLVTKGVPLWAEVEQDLAVPIYEGDVRGKGVKVMFTGDGGGHFYLEWDDGCRGPEVGDLDRGKAIKKDRGVVDDMGEGVELRAKRVKPDTHEGKPAGS